MPKSELAQRLGRNLGLRVIALLTAIGLWLFVNAGQREAQTSLQVPVNFRNLPVSFVIVNSHPDFINLQVSGPSTLLSLLDPGRLALRLDLAGVTPGQTEFKISPDMFKVPRQTSIDRISPSSITIDVDRLVTREVPIRVSLKGTVAAGYTISAIDVKPPSVTVTGPRRVLAHFEQVDTEPFDVRDAATDIEREVRLASLGTLVHFSAQAVHAKAKLQEVVGSREFRGVEVKVRDADFKFRLQPHHVDVTVRGPVRRLSGLNLDGAVYIDGRGASPGTHELPVQVELPEGIELVRQAPEKVKLRVFAGKVGTRS